MKSRVKVALVILLAALIFPAVASATVSVSISPTTVNVQPGGQTQFNAVVSGASNTVVIWSVAGVNCSAVTCGQVSSIGAGIGLYTAPAVAPSPNIVTVTATSLADLSASASAAVIVGTTSDVKVTISPSAATVLAGQEQTFNASVSGTTISGVTWSLSGASCAQSQCGAISQNGIYFAPQTLTSPEQVTVTATSVADPSKSASAVVTLALPVSVSISPQSATVNAGLQKQFTATVSNSGNTAVTWRVSGSGCSGAACGTITSGGLYTAPSAVPSPAQVSVTATSAADPSKSASAIVTVAAPVAVSVTPNTTQVLAGTQKQFTATVTNTTNTAVNWSVAGSGCSGAGCGTITTGGLYTAPSTAPNPPQVFVTATSVADPTKSGTATVTVSLPLSVSVSPSSIEVNAGRTQQFTATVSNSSNTAVNWSLTGSGCSGSSCGTITAGGLYTAPSTIPNPPQVTVTATSVADSTKSGSASITLVAAVAVTISPKSVDLLTGSTQQFTATVTNTSNSAVSWTVAGTGCSGSACGTVSSTGFYTVPGTVPGSGEVFVTATSIADPTKSATASVTISLPLAVKVSPSAVTVPLNGTQQFTATIANSTNNAVTWSLNGSGCSGAACGTITSAGLYKAPASAPNPAQVTVTATSVADPTKSGTAVVTVALPVSVSISPTSTSVAVGEPKQFTATVSNASNTAVTWSVSGAGCSGTACGTVSSTGLYTAPSKIPSPALVSVTATSVADTTKSATAAVTIVAGVSVTVTPTSAQVVIGTHQQFTATVNNTSNTAVRWSLSGCSGAACGTITSAGLYTAPAAVPNPALVVVTATSVADPNRSGTASAIIVPPISITISPKTASVPTGGETQFLATLSGTSNQSITWSVSGSGCSGSACGVVSSSGRYTAPGTIPSPAQVTVKVTSAANTTIFATATVTIVAPVAVKVSPTMIDVAAGNTEQFTATVTGTSNSSVTWSIAGTGCSGASCGTISSAGLYTAPASLPSPPEVTVTATSVANTSKSGSATVTIIPAVAVSVSPAAVQVVIHNQQQFTATVTGSQNTGVTWSLSGAGCGGATCGAISSTGLYTAPSTVPNPAQVKVTARSDADGTKTGSATVTVISPVSVAISPTNATVAISGQQQFQASVAGSTNTAVDWSVSGSGCSGSACGTISSTGLYEAPSSIPSPPTVIVKATSKIDVAESASATVNIVATLNSKLSGQYAFAFNGFDSSGVYQAAGTFTADGAGNITTGLEDVTTTNGVTTDEAISGTYNLISGSRGVLTLSAATGTQVFRFALNGASTSARFIELDNSGIRGSGLFEQQDPSAFSLSSLNGPYVVRLAGEDSAGARIGALAIFDFDGLGNILGGSLDANDGGTIQPTLGSFGGAYRVSTTGRGTANLSIPGFLGGSFRFAFYVVSATKLLFVSIDPLSANNPIFSGPAELQSGYPFAASILDGPTVFSLAGEQANIPQVIIGQIVFDGLSQSLVTFDQNNGGVVATNNVLSGGYTIQVNGPGQLNLNDSSGHNRTWYVYVIGPNHAYMMDLSSPDVGMGELSPQTVEQQYSSADILGSYLLGSGEPLVAAATLTSGATTFNGRGAVTGTVDVSRSASSTGGLGLAGSYNLSTTSNNGRGTMTLTSPSGESFALWFGSSNEVLALELDSSNSEPVVLHFEQ